MKWLRLLGFVFVILLGAWMFVYGEMDDSPGGQLLGLVAIIIGMRRIWKLYRENRSS